MKNLISICLLCPLVLIYSCSKENDSNPVGRAPSNLVINASVSTSGNGIVSFTAKADNAVSYLYEFGNGAIQTVTTGTTEYQYTLTGTNTYSVTVTATSSDGLNTRKTIPVTVTVATTAATLLWSDEFNTDGAPDPAKWGYDIGTGSNGWGNAELQYYTSRPENVIVSGGTLKIKALREAYNGSAFTSARLLSKDKFAFKYGKVEVRAKVPAGGGTWAAAWMLGNNINSAGWPACGEIDIMEHLGNQMNKIYGTLHYPGRSGGNANGSIKTIANATSEFHNYSLDWSATSIKIAVDDVVFHEVPNTAAIPFNQDFFLILNLAMGGNFGGAVDPAFNNATMEVDYVRVYK